MARKTRNSQRDASGAIAPPSPPTWKSRKRPSKKAPAKPTIPFPSVDDTIPQQPEQKTPSPRRRSTGLAPKPALDVSPKPAAIVTPPRAPTTPFRRPPTGSRAKRTVLGDLMPQPPSPAAPVDDSVEEDEEKEQGDDEEEGEQGDEEDDGEYRSPSPQDTEITSPYRILNRKFKEVPELTDIQDIYWKSEHPVVQTAWGVRPTRQEQVEYYQENEWDTDDEEYPEAAPTDEWEVWKPERSPYELFEGVSWTRNMKIKEKFKRAISKHLKLRMFEFPAPNEGAKIRLAEDDGKGQVWVGVAASPKKSPSRSTSRSVDVDENGEPLYDDENDQPASNSEITADTTASIDPTTGLPTAEYFEAQLDALRHEAELVQEEYEAMEKKKATLYGELLIEKQELEEENVALDALWKRLEAIVDPDFFEVLQRCPYGKKPRIKEPFLGGEPREILWSSDEEEEGENVEGQEEDDSTDVEEDGEDADEEMDPDVDPLLDGSDSSDAKEDEDDGDQTKTGLSTSDIADTTGNKIEQTRRRPKPLTREKNMDAATLAELIAGSNPPAAAPAANTTTTSGSTNTTTTTTSQDDNEDEGEDDSSEKLPVYDASIDAESFLRDLLEELNWQSTPPRRVTTSSSNQNENAIPRDEDEMPIIRNMSDLIALLPHPDAPTPSFSDDEDDDSAVPSAHRAPGLDPQAIADALARVSVVPNPAIAEFEANLPPPPQPPVEVVTTTADAKENAPHTPVNNPYVPMRLSPSTPSRWNGQPSTTARVFAAAEPMGPRRRVRSSARIALQTIQSPEKDSDSEDEAERNAEYQRQEEERLRARPAFAIYTGPSLPLDEAEHDRVTHQVKKECIEVVLRDEAYGGSYDWDEFYADEASKKEQKDEKVAEVVVPVVPQFDVWVKRENEEFDAAQKSSDSEDEGEKNLPRRTSFIRESMLKRSRDETDDEESGSDADEKEDPRIASKKRRFSGSYGASDEQTPAASVTQAERARSTIYETDEVSRNRPSSNIPESSDADDCEEEDHVESILSAVSPTGSPSSSRNGSPISLGGLSLSSPTSREVSAPGLQMKRSFAPSPSPHVFPTAPTPQLANGPFSGAQFRTMRGGPSSAVDVEMSDASDEDMEDAQPAPRAVPPALARAPVSPRTAAPALFGRHQLPRSVRNMIRHAKPVNFKDLRK